MNNSQGFYYGAEWALTAQLLFSHPHPFRLQKARSWLKESIPGEKTKVFKGTQNGSQVDILEPSHDSWPVQWSTSLFLTQCALWFDRWIRGDQASALLLATPISGQRRPVIRSKGKTEESGVTQSLTHVLVHWIPN